MESSRANTTGFTLIIIFTLWTQSLAGIDWHVNETERFEKNFTTLFTKEQTKRPSDWITKPMKHNETFAPVWFLNETYENLPRNNTFEDETEALTWKITKPPRDYYNNSVFEPNRDKTKDDLNGTTLIIGEETESLAWKVTKPAAPYYNDTTLELALFTNETENNSSWNGASQHGYYEQTQPLSNNSTVFEYDWYTDETEEILSNSNTTKYANKDQMDQMSLSITKSLENSYDTMLESNLKTDETGANYTNLYKNVSTEPVTSWTIHQSDKVSDTTENFTKLHTTKQTNLELETNTFAENFRRTTHTYSAYGFANNTKHGWLITLLDENDEPCMIMILQIVINVYFVKFNKQTAFLPTIPTSSNDFTIEGECNDSNSSLILVSWDNTNLTWHFQQEPFENITWSLAKLELSVANSEWFEKYHFCEQPCDAFSLISSNNDVSWTYNSDSSCEMKYIPLHHKETSLRGSVFLVNGFHVEPFMKNDSDFNINTC